jgi:NitT/TauT family transport system permease protein
MSAAIRLWQLAVLVALIAGWAALANYSASMADVVGSPLAVSRQMLDWIKSGEIFRNLGITTLEAVLGFAIGAFLGAAVAFLLRFVPVMAWLLDPLIGIVAVVPRIVLAPVFMIWFGLGIASKAALVVTIVFFIVYFNVEAGLRGVSPVLLDRLRIIGASRWGLFKELYLPACLVWILSGLRVSVGFAFLGAVVSEYLGANVGIGSLIAVGQSLNDPNAVMAGLLVIMIVVVPLDRVLSAIEARAAGWRG